MLHGEAAGLSLWLDDGVEAPSFRLMIAPFPLSPSGLLRGDCCLRTVHT